jgi:hypothetical protein
MCGGTIIPVRTDKDTRKKGRKEAKAKVMINKRKERDRN